jgi:hypothetical protein
MADEIIEQPICAFCGEGTRDDPRYLVVRVQQFSSKAVQGLGSHFECLKEKLHPTVAATLIDLTSLPDDDADN